MLIIFMQYKRSEVEALVLLTGAALSCDAQSLTQKDKYVCLSLKLKKRTAITLFDDDGKLNTSLVIIITLVNRLHFIEQSKATRWFPCLGYSIAFAASLCCPLAASTYLASQLTDIHLLCLRRFAFGSKSSSETSTVCAGSKFLFVSMSETVDDDDDDFMIVD